MSDENVIPVSLLGLVARWRSGTWRECPLPGVPWTAGEIGDALAPVLLGRGATKLTLDSIASRGLQEPRGLSADDIRALCAHVLGESK